MSTSTPTTPAAATDTATPSRPTPPTAPPTAPPNKTTQRAEKLHKELVKAEQRKRPVERVSDKTLWEQALRTATAEIRREAVKAKAKAVTAETVTSVTADVRSAVHRNRRQLAPWLLTVPYATAGEVAHLLATYGDGVPIGISALCAASTAGASLLAWRKKLAKRTPAKFKAKMQAGMAALCAWTTAMPLVPASGQAGMWLSLVGGTAFLGLSWWREHAHPIPLAPDVAALDLSALDLPSTADDDQPRMVVATDAEMLLAEQIMADWDTFVAGMGTLPGSKLSRPQRIEYGWTFRLNLVRGKQKLTDARAAKDSIAAALNLDTGNISIDRDTSPTADQTTVIFTVITDPVTNAYDGPRIIRDGGDIYIEIGPYEDGIGTERMHVLADQLTAEEIEAGQRPRGSMNGGFALGTKGSGKSRLLELIAVGLRKLGIEIWYLDPQGGKSSPALMAEADWPLAGVHGTKGAYTNVVDLWKAIKAVCEVREAEGGDTEQGFQHTRRRPAIMVIIDECHGVFQADNPETGNSFGQDFAQLDRIMRKNGVGLLGASQAITQDTFGRGNAAAVLRDGMCAVNVFLMSYGGKNLRLAPGYDDQPCGNLPTNQGFGYNPKGARPHTRWQARYTPDFQPWLARYPKATLDELTQKWIGDIYLKRFEQHASNQAAKKAWLEALATWDGNEATRPVPPGEQAAEDERKSQAGSTNATVLSLLSPHQRRMQAAGTGPVSASTADGVLADVLTDTERRVLDIVRGEPQNPTTLATALNVSPQAAGRHLRNLAAKNQAVKLDDGRYQATV